MNIETSKPEEVVKEAFWLAYQAAGPELGAGIFQRKENTTKDDVWNNVRSHGDYPGTPEMKAKYAEKGKAYGDYIFGRMCKLRIEWDDTSIMIPNITPRSDYQGWSRKYPTYESLVRAAIENVGK